MRKIKFRGRSQYDGHWVYGYLIGDDLIAGGIKVKYPLEIWNDIRELDEWEEVDPETVGQYTGFRDKNGAEIYEGDILLHSTSVWTCGSRYREIRGVVEFLEGSWMLIDSEREDTMYLCDQTENMVVISNVYQNPKLLEDQP